MAEVAGPFRLVSIELKAALLPVSAGNPLDAVKRQLNDLLFKFNEELGAIPLTYSELQFPKGREYGRIMGEHPWVHVDVLTKLTVFQPERGQSLQGVVSTISDSHISLLVFGLFNASISADQLRRLYHFNYQTNLWESTAAGLGPIQEGSPFNFIVGGLQQANGVINITGWVNND